jgi:Iron-sulfur cluster binding domain of dihydroorotate dehydrogenase B
VHHFDAIVRELRFSHGATTARIKCAPAAIPAAGQYVMAWSPMDLDAPLAIPLFASKFEPDGFLTAPPVPRTWEPGSILELRGPLGRGFGIYPSTRRLVVVSLEDTSARLMPVMRHALEHDIAVTFFSSLPVTDFPAEVEISPLQELADALHWADLLIFDLALDDLFQLRKLLHLSPEDHLPCPAQALIVTKIVCGGLAECGACLVPKGRTYRLSCIDGPVFDLNDLTW